MDKMLSDDDAALFKRCSIYEILHDVVQNLIVAVLKLQLILF